MLARYLPVLAVCVLGLPVSSQSPMPGLRLYSPLGGTESHLVDVEGAIVHTWTSALQTRTATYLDDDGTLYRSVWGGIPTPLQGAGGRLERVDLDSNVLWDFRYDHPGVLSHHDIEVLPNGNVLMLAWEDKSIPEAIEAGRDPTLMSGPLFRPDHIIEVRQTGPSAGEIVWEWHVWDHLIQDFDSCQENYGVVADHPELIDVTSPQSHHRTGTGTT